MHTPIENELERFLAGRPVSQTFRDHLSGCGGCREEMGFFEHQARLIRSLQVTPQEAEIEAVAPAGGFYARVMERISEMEGESPASIWTIFLQPFGQRLAFASLAVFMALSGVLLTVDPPSEQAAAAPHMILADETAVPSVLASQRITGNAEADRAAVFTQLVTFEQ